LPFCASSFFFFSLLFDISAHQRLPPSSPKLAPLTLFSLSFLTLIYSTTGLLGSMDMVEVNPFLGQSPTDRSETVNMAIDMVSSALGSRIL